MCISVKDNVAIIIIDFESSIKQQEHTNQEKHKKNNTKKTFGVLVFLPGGFGAMIKKLQKKVLASVYSKHANTIIMIF